MRVLDDETIRSIEAVAVDSAAAEFAVQASEYALGWLALRRFFRCGGHSPYD